jgi:hypothetical protein
LRYQLAGAFMFVMLVVAYLPLLDSVMIQEFLSLARVFASDQIHFLQDPNGAKSDVLQVADGRGNKE